MAEDRISASADLDTEAWMSWLACAFVENYLTDLGGERFAIMDIKLALSLQMMLRSAPDDAKDVVHGSKDRSDMVSTIQNFIRLE